MYCSLKSAGARRFNEVCGLRVNCLERLTASLGYSERFCSRFFFGELGQRTVEYSAGQAPGCVSHVVC